MTLDEVVNRGLKHECVVYRDHPDFGLLIPTRLTSTGEWGIHDIVRDEEERLQLHERQKGGAHLVDKKNSAYKLHAPAKDGDFLVFTPSQGCALEDLEWIDDGNASVKLSTRYVVVKILGGVSIHRTLRSVGCGTHVCIPLNGLVWHALGSEVVDQLGSNAREHILESLSGHVCGALENKGEETRREVFSIKVELCIIWNPHRHDNGEEKAANWQGDEAGESGNRERSSMYFGWSNRRGF
jgi:hypothetical protein